MAKVALICAGCSKQFEVKYKQRKQKYCTRECVNKSHVGSGNPAFGKAYRTKESHPEWAEKIRTTSSERGINKGEKNGMKNPEVAKRAGETRSKKFKEDASFKLSVSAYIRKAWADGKFDNVPVGRCKWYNHTRSNGEIVKLQGTWEVVFARHMDSLQVDYKAHRGRIVYTDDQGVERSYYPDFYVPMWNAYVDVKGAFFTKLHKNKFDWIRASNPEIMIYLVTKEEFLSMGIDILKEAKELLIGRAVSTKNGKQ